MTCNDHPLNLVGSLVNRGDLRVPVPSFHAHSLEIAAAAENLQCVVANLQGDVRGIHLRHGRFLGIRLARLLELRRLIDQQSGSLELCGHIRKLEGNPLIHADGGAELHAFLRIGQGILIRTLGDAQCLGGNADAPAIQCGHSNLEALSFEPQQVFLRDTHVVKLQLRCAGGPDAHLVIGLREGESGHVLFDDKRRNPAGALCGIRAGEHHIGVGFRGIGDEDLPAVEDIVIPVLHGCGLCAAGITACILLCQAEGSQFAAGGDIRQVFPLLFLVSEMGNGVGAQGSVSREDDADATIHAGEFLDGNGVGFHICAGTFVLRFIGQSHETGIGHLLHELPGKLVVQVQVHGHGRDVVFRQGPHLLPECLVVSHVRILLFIQYSFLFSIAVPIGAFLTLCFALSQRLCLARLSGSRETKMVYCPQE